MGKGRQWYVALKGNFTPGMQDRIMGANLTEGNNNVLDGRITEASTIEEPGAGNPHAGIWAGGAG
jgi:hypothetical protein